MLRKLIHIVFSIPLIVPLLANLNNTYTEAYFTVLLVGASLLYIYQVKKPIISEVLKSKINDARDALRSHIAKAAEAMNIPNADSLIESMDKFEEALRDFIRSVERDYERRWGYLGVLMGMVGVYVSYIAFNTYAYYGVLALIFYDTVSALVGYSIGRVKLPYSSVTFEGALAGALAFSASSSLMAGLNNMPYLYLVGLALGLAEAYSGEDNLTIPIVASGLTYLMHMPKVA